MTPTTAVIWEAVTSVERAELDGQIVLYDPARHQAHLLNPTASAILASIDGRADTTDIAHTLADLFDVPATRINGDVLQTIESLADRHLIRPAGTNDSSAVEPLPDAAMVMAATHGVAPVLRTDSDVPPGEWRFASPCFAALDLRFAILTNDEELGRYLTDLLADLVVSEPPQLWYAVSPQRATDPPESALVNDLYDLRLGSSPPSISSRSLSAVIGRLLWDYNHRAITTAKAPLLLHASAARTPTGAVICPAPADSGKSTLITALVLHGFDYLTDECASIDPSTLSVRCYPKPIGLDPGSWPLFPDVVVPDQRQPIKAWLRASTMRMGSELFAERSARIEPGTGVPIAAIVFNRYVTNGGSNLAERLAPAEVVVRLARNTFRLAENPRDGLRSLVKIAGAVPAYELAVDDLGVACAAVEALLLSD